jgi:hypothetical protein
MVIEHVQTGTRAVVASPTDAVAWITDQTSPVGEGQGGEQSSPPRTPAPAAVSLVS